MFKGKVYMYINVNGKEEKLEREFDNPQDFQFFAKQMPSFSIGIGSHPLGLNGWGNINDYFDYLLDKKMGGQSSIAKQEMPWLVNMDKYEQALEELEYQKTHKEEHLKELKATMKKLKDYKKKFTEEGKEDLITQIDEDIKKIEEEIEKSQ